MIKKIGVEDTINSSAATTTTDSMGYHANPNFKGGAWALVLQGLQECEKNPMINVAVIDLLSAILPRTIIESMTNIFAGFEAFRRESSGLLINCMLPGFLVAGIAKLAQKGIMGKDTTDLSHCFANSDTINLVSNTWAKVGDEAIDAINTMSEELEKRPISIKTLNLRTDTARDLVLKVYNTINETSKTAKMAEMAIVYGNRYRVNNKDVDLGLMRAESAFYKGSYKLSLEQAITAINIVEPGIHKKLLDEYKD